MYRLRVLLAVLSLFLKVIPDPMIRHEVDEEYDFIVVGAGTSGSVVASRLSEDPHTKVLLLEAGFSDRSKPMIKVPALAPYLEDSLWADWQYVTEPQKHAMLQNPTQKWPRGKVLGGTSSFNYQAYVRGSPHDFDYWEDLGAEGWSFKDVEAFFKKAENAMVSDMSDNLGKNGPLKLTLTNPEMTRTGELVLKAAREIGIDIVDYMDNFEGISRVTQTVFKGIRQNSATAYLRPVYKERMKRLHIVVGAHVIKILTERGGEISEEPRAIGVQYMKKGKLMTAKARREIVVCGGVIGSPQLLLVSGIGPRKQLEKFNIPVVVDSPGVGENLQDHTRYFAYFTTNWKRDDARIEDTKNYIMNGSLPFGQFPFLFMHEKSSYFDTERSMSTSKRPFPELQYYIQDLMKYQDGAHFQFTCNQNHMKSTGTIKLRSDNPDDHPLIDPNSYENEDDLIVHVDGFRIMEKFELSSAFKEAGARMIPPTYCNGSQNTEIPRSDEYYRCIIKEGVIAGYHPCCSVKMGAADDNMAVLDPQLRVRGIRGLRVADASIMPHITSANLQSPCYMIGEKTADMIKKTWGMS